MYCNIGDRGLLLAQMYKEVLHNLAVPLFFYDGFYIRTDFEEDDIMTPMNNADYLIRLQHADELDAMKAAKRQTDSHMRRWQRK